MVGRSNASRDCLVAAGMLMGGSALAGGTAAVRPPPGEIDGQWTSVAVSMGLPAVPETEDLVDCGTDSSGRRLRLVPGACEAWQAMRAAARAEGVQLFAVSGFRSRARQAELVRRKLERGMGLRQALAINAVPGYSQHHGGYALDIGTPGSRVPLVLGNTAAFRWLERRAQAYGFSLSYPRGNPHGMQYEPWHWAWHELRLADAEAPPQSDPPQAAETPAAAEVAQASIGPTSSEAPATTLAGPEDAAEPEAVSSGPNQAATANSQSH